jgi:uncharacterized membrane protein YvlD (DUF360 family)
MITSLLADLLLTAILLQVLASVLPGFEIEGVGPAFVAALIASVAGVVVQIVTVPLIVPHVVQGGWMPYGLRAGLSSVAVAIGIAFAPGIKAAPLSILLAAVIVSVASSGLMLAVAPLLIGRLAF